jgi:hypothetical protein
VSRRWGYPALGFLLITSCGRSRERSEADRVLHAIDALRDAPGSAKAQRQELLSTLEKEKAEGEAADRARAACSKAYRLLLEANALTEKVASELDAGAMQTVVQDLREADAKQKASAEAMPHCDEAAADLRRLAR